jgi:hypothetical protein
MKTRAWTRYTEAFPQPWHTEVTTPSVTDEGILTLMQTCRQEDGADVKTLDQYKTAGTMGLKIQDGAGRDGVILFRRQLDKNGAIDSGGARSDGQSATIFTANNVPDEWLIARGGDLLWQGKVLLRSANSISANASFHSGAAKAVVRFAGKPGEMKLSLPFTPKQVFVSASGRPEDAVLIKSTFANGVLTVNINADSGVLWVDPTVSLTAPIPAASLQVTDSQGSYQVPLRAAWSQTGDWIYYAQTDVREPGVYQFNGAGTYFTVQDIWDNTQTSRGDDAVKSTFREGSELYFEVKPGTTPYFTATQQKSFRGQIDNLLFNGDFEVGIPNYPPRLWSLRGGRTVDLGWAGWSQEKAHSGKSSLRFFRAGDLRVLTSQPMRLRSGGEYHLRFFAQGDIKNAQVQVNGPLKNTLTVPIKPSSDWQEYDAQITLPPGYTTLQIDFGAGDPNQIVWVDDVQFGQIAK